jgi:hypothetical protein
MYDLLLRIEVAPPQRANLADPESTIYANQKPHIIWSRMLVQPRQQILLFPELEHLGFGSSPTCGHSESIGLGLHPSLVLAKADDHFEDEDDSLD